MAWGHVRMVGVCIYGGEGACVKNACGQYTSYWDAFWWKLRKKIQCSSDLPSLQYINPVLFLSLIFQVFAYN